MRHAARRDANDAIITEALRAQGFNVIDYGKAGQGIPDKLVTRTLPDGVKWICWVEIKTEKGKLREGQSDFEAIFAPREEFYVARNPVETIREMYTRFHAAIRPEHWR